jgi:hypothetical protein
MLAMPVEMISGLPVAATRRINGRSVFSKLAILYAGTSRLSRKSTAVSSNGVENASMPSSLARAKIGACHSHGVWAFSYRSYSEVPAHRLFGSLMKNSPSARSRVMVCAV